MDPVIRKATPDDAKAVVLVLNSVILEGKRTALTNPFTEAEERAFITGLCDRSAPFVAEVDGKIVGIQSIEPDASELGADWAGATTDRAPARLHAIVDTTPAWTRSSKRSPTSGPAAGS